MSSAADAVHQIRRLGQGPGGAAGRPGRARDEPLEKGGTAATAMQRPAGREGVPGVLKPPSFNLASFQNITEIIFYHLEANSQT